MPNTDHEQILLNATIIVFHRRLGSSSVVEPRQPDNLLPKTCYHYPSYHASVAHWRGRQGPGCGRKQSRADAGDVRNIGGCTGVAVGLSTNFTGNTFSTYHGDKRWTSYTPPGARSPSPGRRTASTPTKVSVVSSQGVGAAERELGSFHAIPADSKLPSWKPPTIWPLQRLSCALHLPCHPQTPVIKHIFREPAQPLAPLAPAGFGQKQYLLSSSPLSLWVPIWARRRWRPPFELSAGRSRSSVLICGPCSRKSWLKLQGGERGPTETDALAEGREPTQA